MSETTVLILPGWMNSGETHWQTLWENTYPDFQRVNQADWNVPILADWLQNLETAVANAPHPVILVAHSLGVSLAAQFASQAKDRVRGALLVAPADVESPAHTPDVLRGFGPLPRKPLPFNSIVVASENDPYVSIERAQQVATSWDSDFLNIGKLGHINADSGLGLWNEGLSLLNRLRS